MDFFRNPINKRDQILGENLTLVKQTMMKHMFFLFGVYLILLPCGLVAGQPASPPPPPPMEQRGEGSTLPFPLYSMLLFGWDQLDPTNKINYYQTTSARAIASMIGPKTAQGNLWAGADLLPTDQQLATSQSNNRDLRWFPSALISLIPYANYGSLNLTSF